MNQLVFWLGGGISIGSFLCGVYWARLKWCQERGLLFDIIQNQDHPPEGFTIAVFQTKK